MQDGWAPLLRASVSGHHETVEVLLAHKADVNAKNKVSRGSHTHTHMCTQAHLTHTLGCTLTLALAFTPPNIDFGPCPPDVSHVYLSNSLSVYALCLNTGKFQAAFASKSLRPLRNGGGLARTQGQRKCQEQGESGRGVRGCAYRGLRGHQLCGSRALGPGFCYGLS